MNRLLEGRHLFSLNKAEKSHISLRYGYHKGDPRLRELIARNYPGLTAENITATCGASEAIICMVMGLLEPGDHVIVEHPNYGSLIDNPRARGCDVELLTLRHEDNFAPDIDRLESMIRPDTKMVILTHPSNPTGTSISEDTLRRIVALAEKHDFLLLFDELYRKFAFDNPLPTAASLSPNVISLDSMSKVFGIPGIRVGWIATQRVEIADRIRDVREHISISSSTLSEAIAIQVLEREEKFIAHARSITETNRAIVDNWIIGHANVEWVPPDVGIVAFPRLKKDRGVSPAAFFDRLVGHYKTFVVDASMMEYDPHHFRLGFGCASEELTTGLEMIDKAIADVQME